MPCFEHRRDDIYQLNTLRESTGVDSKSTHDYDFGGHLIPKDIVFMQSEHSIAFTNIRCVVPGRKKALTLSSQLACLIFDRISFPFRRSYRLEAPGTASR